MLLKKTKKTQKFVQNSTKRNQTINELDTGT